VSQLKQHVPATTKVSSDLSSLPTDPMQQVSPIAVVDQRVICTGTSPIHQLRIRWSELSSSMSTWEEIIDVQRQFPDAPAWGQADFRGGSNVRAHHQPPTKSE